MELWCAFMGDVLSREHTLSRLKQQGKNESVRGGILQYVLSPRAFLYCYALGLYCSEIRELKINCTITLLDHKNYDCPTGI